MSDLVIDCSIVMSWHFEDEVPPYAESILGCLSRFTAVAPAIFYPEMLNALLMGERRKRTTAIKADLFLQDVLTVRIEIETATPPQSFERILTLARIHRLSAYDATYLELALRQQLPLASSDHALCAAAQSEGVMLFEPTSRG